MALSQRTTTTILIDFNWNVPYVKRQSYFGNFKVSTTFFFLFSGSIPFVVFSVVFFFALLIRFCNFNRHWKSSTSLTVLELGNRIKNHLDGVRFFEIYFVLLTCKRTNSTFFFSTCDVYQIEKPYLKLRLEEMFRWSRFVASCYFVVFFFWQTAREITWRCWGVFWLLISISLNIVSL